MGDGTALAAFFAFIIFVVFAISSGFIPSTYFFLVWLSHTHPLAFAAVFSAILVSFVLLVRNLDRLLASS
jgi:ABC-type polysaccharide/polyol phosphate export permease